MSENNYINLNEIERAINLLVSPGQLFEIRGISKISKPPTFSGIFDSAEQCKQALIDYSKQWHSANPWKDRNIYITLNAPNHKIKGLAQYGRILEKIERSTKDEDIIKRNWLLIDLDPEREPASISSSDEEKQKAADLASEVLPFMLGLGFPEPVKADSGNGYHFLFKIDLPSDVKPDGTKDDSTFLIDSCLKALHHKFSNAFVKVDTSVDNAARISKLYGTLAQKGSNTPERPHRMAKILSIPDKIETTPVEVLQALAAMAPAEETQTANNKTQAKQKAATKTSPSTTSNVSPSVNGYYIPTNGVYDLQEFMRIHNITVKRIERDGNATAYTIDHCPFNTDHTDNVKLWQNDNYGSIGFNCHHNHCKGKSWQDVREHFEPGVYAEIARRQEAWKQLHDNPASVFDDLDHMEPEYIDPPEPPTLEERQAEYNKTSAGSRLNDIISQFKEAHKTKPISCGFPALDVAMGGGLYEGLYIMGALSGLGKTCFCLQVAEQVAQQGYDVLYFNMEMPEAELVARGISRNTYLESMKLYFGDSYARTTRNILTGEAWSIAEGESVGHAQYKHEVVEKAVNAYSEYCHRIRFITNNGIRQLGIADIQKAVDKHIELTGKTPIVFIDYLQIAILADHDRSRPTEKEKVDFVVFGLKALSMKHHIPVIAISSLNRENYYNPISMEALKQSGNLEYTADVGIGLQFYGMDFKKVINAKGKLAWESKEDRAYRIRELLEKINQLGIEGKNKPVQAKIIKQRNAPPQSVALWLNSGFNCYMNAHHEELQRLVAELEGEARKLAFDDEIQEDSVAVLFDKPEDELTAVQKFVENHYQRMYGWQLQNNGPKNILLTIESTGEAVKLKGTVDKNSREYYISYKGNNYYIAQAEACPLPSLFPVSTPLEDLNESQLSALGYIKATAKAPLQAYVATGTEQVTAYLASDHQPIATVTVRAIKTLIGYMYQDEHGQQLENL